MTAHSHERGWPGANMNRMILDLDADNARDINAAIALYQRTFRHDDGDTMVGEGEGDLAGAILGEICRDWLAFRARSEPC